MTAFRHKGDAIPAVYFESEDKNYRTLNGLRRNRSNIVTVVDRFIIMFNVQWSTFSIQLQTVNHKP